MTGDTLEYVVGLMIKDAIRQPPLRYGGLHDHWEQDPGRRHQKLGLRSIDLRQLRSPTGTVQHMTEHTLAFFRFRTWGPHKQSFRLFHHALDPYLLFRPGRAG